MLKKKIGAMFLALAMLSSIALTACNSSDKGESESAASEVATESATETETETEPTSTESAVPSIMEDFGGDAITYEPRGEVQLDVEDADGADGKVLHVSNRTENWNGVNFPCDNMAGNTINIKTSVKSPSDHVIISLQFDMLGSTKYENVIHISGCKDSFAVGEGTTPIPETATNVYVYVENSTTDDIYIDYMYVTIEGDYFDPANAADVELVDISSYESLKDLYKDDFYIGCCVPDSFVTSPVEEPRTLLLNQFNSITCENEMKPENVLDAATTLADPEKYNESPALDFTKAITILDFAKENNLKMRGHTLVWHSQTPDWFFYENYDTSANLASRELMLKRLENYIKGVFEFVNTNYPGMFYAFDVANECVDDSNNLRESNWTKTIGPDFLEYAFKYARQYAGDDIKLFYNDYNEYDSGKRTRSSKFLSRSPRQVTLTVWVCSPISPARSPWRDISALLRSMRTNSVLRST